MQSLALLLSEPKAVQKRDIYVRLADNVLRKNRIFVPLQEGSKIQADAGTGLTGGPGRWENVWYSLMHGLKILTAILVGRVTKPVLDGSSFEATHG